MELQKTCPICGKEWEILNAEDWTYKVRDGHKTIYFCRYYCMRCWQEKHERRPLYDRPVYHSEIEARKEPRERMNSRELIEKMLEIISEDGSIAAAEHLEQIGYDQWKKWWQLKDWARRHAPELREQMPEKLRDRRMKEAKA